MIMGVPGLYGFLNKRRDILKEIRLSKVKLIVDGSIIVFQLCNSHASNIYGGDYKVLKESCKAIFDSFKACEIVPYVVFDGIKDPKGFTFRSTIKKENRNTEDAKKVSKGESERYLPLFAHDVLVEVVEELGVKCVSCAFGADYHIASLAMQWNVPVLTNDSDYFIFELPAGVIIFDHLNTNVKKDDKGVNYLEAKMFCFHDLAKFAGITDLSLLPLFAALMGNNVMDAIYLKPFYLKYNVPFGSEKIKVLLERLAKMKNYSTAFEMAVGSFPYYKQDNVRNNLGKSVASFTTGVTFLSDYFETPLDAEQTYSNYFEREVGAEQFNILNQVVMDPIPEWFQIELYKRTLSSRISNVLVTRRIILKSQVENFRDVSSHHCSLMIRQTVYSLLLKDRQCQPDQKINEVKEYDRDKDELNEKVIKCKTEFKDGSSLPSLEEIPSLQLERKVSIILELFTEEQRWFLDYPQKEQLFLAVLTYWVYNATTKVQKCQVLSLLIYFYAPDVLQKLVDQDNSIESFQPLLETTVSNHLENFLNRMKYFDIKHIHNFSQFQTCFQCLSDLNKLLRYPLQNISISDAFCATSLSYICHHMKSAEAEIVSKTSTSSKQINDVMKMFGPNCLDETP